MPLQRKGNALQGIIHYVKDLMASSVVETDPSLIRDIFSINPCLSLNMSPNTHHKFDP